MSEIIRFTYAGLPAPVAAEIEATATRSKDRLIRQVTDIIETGRDLQEVKGKLEHGQFEPWLKTSFNMTARTAQKYMRAAEYFADKSELSSHLTPNTIYLLSAKSTPEVVHEQVVERLESGLPAEPEYIRHVVHDAKLREREAKDKKGKKEARAARKRQKARWAREQRKEEEEHQRKEAAAKATAREVAEILVDKLSKDEIDTVYKALGLWDVTNTMLRAAIIEARHSHSDNATTFPPKPWESES